MDHCEYMSAQKQISPMVRKFVNFWKFTGAEAIKMPCPMIGEVKFINMSINSQFMSFIPKGIIKAVTKTYNNEDGLIFLMSIIFAIN
jgi:hypothetical protein